jgi:hypothetical protein
MERQNKKWTKEEEQYLEENWGTISVRTLAKNLGRSEHAVNVRRQRLGLGAFLNNGDYITFNQLKCAIGIGGGTGYMNISWIKNRGFPVHTKRVKQNSFKIVYLDEWWKWAEQNKDLLDFSKFEENVLGKEPAWAKEKRRLDILKNQKYITTPWTKAEDDKLIRLVKQQKYTYLELAKLLRRTDGAITRRLNDFGISERPIRESPHNCWTDNDLYQLGELIKAGYSYPIIAEHLNKSAKACRGKVYNTYLTENLDKARAIMTDGNFGDNRPERKVKQRNVMNTEERIAVNENLTALTAILQYRFKQQINETEWGEFFQKDMCKNFSSDCLKTVGCDECMDFQKIDPQNCKMCGRTFFEKKDNLYCGTCRNMRKKQWLRKRFILNR